MEKIRGSLRECLKNPSDLFAIVQGTYLLLKLELLDEGVSKLFCSFISENKDYVLQKFDQN